MKSEIQSIGFLQLWVIQAVSGGILIKTLFIWLKKITFQLFDHILKTDV